MILNALLRIYENKKNSQALIFFLPPGKNKEEIKKKAVDNSRNYAISGNRRWGPLLLGRAFQNRTCLEPHERYITINK